MSDGSSSDKSAAGADKSAAAEEAVPRLPRGRGIRLSGMELIRVIGLAAVLGFLIVTQRPCANAVSTFVTSFDRGSAGSAGGSAAAGSATGSAGDLDRYEQLRPGMTEEETKAAIDRARAKAH